MQCKILMGENFNKCRSFVKKSTYISMNNLINTKSVMWYLEKIMGINQNALVEFVNV